MNDVKEAIRQFVVTRYLPGESPANVRDETRLLSSGILDSLAVLGLVSFVEQTYGIEVTTAERTAESLDRIKDIAALVARKVNARNGRPEAADAR